MIGRQDGSSSSTDDGVLAVFGDASASMQADALLGQIALVSRAAAAAAASSFVTKPMKTVKKFGIGVGFV